MRRWWPIPLLVGVAACVAALDGNAGLRSWWDVRVALREAEVERAELQREVDALRATADALESDRFAIERAIRERLRLAKDGETLLRLSEPDTASPRFP